MSTLAEIEEAVETLPPEQQQQLMRFLAARLPQPHPQPLPPGVRGGRGFPVSRGRAPFTSEDVARIEAEER